MKKIIASLLVKINLAVALTLLFAIGSVNGQTFPDGLVGLSSINNNPSVLYSIDASNGTATPIVTLDTEVSITGIAYLQGTLYGSDLCFEKGLECETFFIGSISTSGITTFLSNQNGSSNWFGLGSDEAGGVMYSIDFDNSNILTAQFPDGSVATIGSGTGIEGPGLEYDDTHGILYAISSDKSLYTISTVTGTANLIGPTGILESSFLLGLAYDECNQILYLNDGQFGQLYTVNVNTGEVTLVGSNGVDAEIEIDGLAWKGPCGITGPSQIPTLSEWGLIAMAGLMGIVGFIVMRKKKVTA